MYAFIAEEQPIVDPPLLLCCHQEFQKHSMTKKFNLHEIGKSNNIWTMYCVCLSSEWDLINTYSTHTYIHLSIKLGLSLKIISWDF